ncbi:uncharacterized protein METZ01_LOCUS182862, partial [marine metagenome]
VGLPTVRVTCDVSPSAEDTLRRLGYGSPRGGPSNGIKGNRFGGGSGTIGATATPVEWTTVLPPNGDDDAVEPPWLDSLGTAVTVREEGTYLVSWSISWTSDSEQAYSMAVGNIEWDEAITYLHVRSAKTGEDTQVGGKSHAIEVNEVKSSLVFPATAIYLYSGDAILTMVEKNLPGGSVNSSDGTWTVDDDSWLNLMAF